jgi:hypothetical protein
MTNRQNLQKDTVAKLREHADVLKHNVATWQLLARAADEIERLQERIAILEAELRVAYKLPDAIDHSFQ